MNNRVPIADRRPTTTDFDVIVVGGGPAGATAAIRLAESGLRVAVLEEKRMPREKLCGEFITPECFPTLGRLAVMDRMLDAGAQKITRLCLTASSGEVVQTEIADMSDVAAWALSLSRARFDQILFDRAREAGAFCFEGFAVGRCIFEGGAAVGVQALSLPEGEMVDFKAALIVDASGRTSRLMLKHDERVGGRRGSRLYALKGHLRGVEGIEDQVELYFFPQGYGGLSRVEDGLINLCFIANERTFRDAAGDAEEIIKRSIMKNRLARERLARAEVVGKWLSVGPLSFGKRRFSKDCVIAIGDAVGMIDPFTGTGIQMALRTGEIAAEAIIACMKPGLLSTSTGRMDLAREVLASYRARYDAEFGSRMIVAAALRGVAFSPPAANLLARVFARAPWLARRVLRATRGAKRLGTRLGSSS